MFGNGSRCRSPPSVVAEALGLLKNDLLAFAFGDSPHAGHHIGAARRALRDARNTCRRRGKRLLCGWSQPPGLHQVTRPIVRDISDGLERIDRFRESAGKCSTLVVTSMEVSDLPGPTRPRRRSSATAGGLHPRSVHLLMAEFSSLVVTA